MMQNLNPKKKEQLDNLTTALILQGQLYCLVFSLIFIGQYQSYEKFEKMLADAEVTMSSLKVSETYHLSGQAEPYRETKEHLEEIGKE